MKPLRFVIPNGSLSCKVIQYLNIAGYPVRSPDRTGFCGKVGGVEFYQLDRRMIPFFLQSGFDAGITGHDLAVASGLFEAGKLFVRGDLVFSRETNSPTRWVLIRKRGALHQNSPIRIGCELPNFAEWLLKNHPLPEGDYTIVKIEGSEEQSVACGMIDMAIVVTETGGSIRANDLEIVPGYEDLLVSVPKILVGSSHLTDDQQRELQALTLALQSVANAQAYVMVCFDIPSRVDLSVLDLPSSVAPTRSPLTDSDWVAVEVCIPRSTYGHTLSKLVGAGAKSINLQEVQGHLL